MATAVDVQQVSKRFRLFQEKYSSFKERLIHAGKIPYHDLWALSDITFEVEEGETVGILGRNGSGKSTLLKCMCGVLQPTSGQVVVRGTLAGLLELGAGFQQELSGRDNIYLNGSLLGLSRREIDKKFDEIVAFAELEQFIDNQVKFYSSGMYIRLGFAVAVNIEPDILVIDEVLAVGDERFQAKCMERVRQFQEDGRTIILVSHSAEQVRSICDRALVLNGGQLVAAGAPGESISRFREILLQAGDALPGGSPHGNEVTGVEPAGPAEGDGALGIGPGARPVHLTEVTVEHAGDDRRPHLHPGDPLVVTVGFEADRRVEDLEFSIELRHEQLGLLHRTDTSIIGAHLIVEPGKGAVRFSVRSFPLLEGLFDVAVGVHSHLGGVTYDWRESACQFQVVNPSRQSGVVALDIEAALVPVEDLATVAGGEG